MGPDRSNGIIIEWNDDSNTGIIDDCYRDYPIFLKLENYALNRFSSSDYSFKPNIGETVDYEILYYDKPTAIGVTNKKYWAIYHHWNKAQNTATNYRKKFYISLVVNLILLVLVVLLLWLLKVIIFE